MMAALLGFTLLFLIQFAQGYPYPSYSDKRYQRASYHPAYVPVPMPYSMSQGYDDAQQEISQSYLPYYYYYPYRTDRRINYYDEIPTQINDGETDQGTYPFGQEMWYEGDNGNVMSATASAAAAREAILQNLIIAQMYEDAAASAAVSGFPTYKMPAEEYENKDWKYGVPTTGVEDNERARQYLKNEEDEEVKELENLRKAKESAKEGKRRRKQKDKEGKKAKDQEKEMKEALGLVKRQDELFATITPRPILTESVLAESAAVGRKTISGGQKEVVLPMPARPGRQPFAELTQRLHIRSDEPSAYQTIKQLLAMENNLKKTDESRIQKRFVSNEEQLTQQLRGLKKSTL